MTVIHSPLSPPVPVPEKWNNRSWSHRPALFSDTIVPQIVRLVKGWMGPLSPAPNIQESTNCRMAATAPVTTDFLLMKCFLMQFFMYVSEWRPLWCRFLLHLLLIFREWWWWAFEKGAFSCWSMTVGHSPKTQEENTVNSIIVGPHFSYELSSLMPFWKVQSVEISRDMKSGQIIPMAFLLLFNFSLHLAKGKENSISWSQM